MTRHGSPEGGGEDERGRTGALRAEHDESPGSARDVSVEVEEPEDEPLHGEVKDYRQPLVTSLGIILGFLLSYLAGWANASDGLPLADAADVATLSTIVGAVALFVVVIWRMLNPALPRRDPLAYYRTTLRLYIVAIVIAFAGFLVAWVL